MKIYDEVQRNDKYEKTYVYYDIIDQFINNKGNKIVSVVDPDIRAARKSFDNIKRGYKNHIYLMKVVRLYYH